MHPLQPGTVNDEAVADAQPAPTVFLSYASEDRAAARAMRDALSGHGLEVWYDENELGGGEAWDQKIRTQIRECRYFLALVSAQTEARLEGYFRREWRLAVERTLDMADDYLFLLPIVIDATDQAAARVPEKFKTVQWLRVPGGQATPALEALCRRLTDARATPPDTTRRNRGVGLRQPAMAYGTPAFPVFPAAVPGDKMRTWGNGALWAARCAWVVWKRAPKWVRMTVSLFLVVSILSQGKFSDEPDPDVPPAAAQTLKKLEKLDKSGQSATSSAEIAKLGAQFVKELADSGNETTPGSLLLALPFSAPPNDAQAAKVADSTFAMVYGKLEMSHPGQIGLSRAPLASADLGAAVERGRANHSQFVLSGGIETLGTTQALSIKIASAKEARVLWSKSYPLAAADPATIAADVDANAPVAAAAPATTD